MAQAAPAQHYCQPDNLTGGTWKMIQFSETPPRKEADWVRRIPYHYLAFYQDNAYSFVATEKEKKTPAEVIKSLSWPQAAKKTMRYTLDAQGILNLYIDKVQFYSYRCIIVTSNSGMYRKNDLILTGYTKGRKSELNKLYRRWF